jgi:hypothetical protein
MLRRKDQRRVWNGHKMTMRIPKNMPSVEKAPEAIEKSQMSGGAVAPRDIAAVVTKPMRENKKQLCRDLMACL